MNTKSMVLILNSLILCNSVNHGFSIASARKKIVNICAALGKKSLVILSGIALILLTTFGMKGGYLESKARGLGRACFPSNQRSFHRGSNPRFLTQAQSVFFNPDGTPLHQHQQWPAMPTQLLPLPHPAASDSRSLLNCTRPLCRREDQAEEEAQREEERYLYQHYLTFRQTLEEIRKRRRYFPEELQGTRDNPNLLETMPREIVQLIVQFCEYKRWVHACSFYAPLHHTDDKLAKGEKESEWLPRNKHTSINFVDGDPQTLELALRLRHNRNATSFLNRNLIDAITIDTSTYSQKVEIGKENSVDSDFPESYVQRGIGQDDCFIEYPHQAGFLPLRQQINFVDRYNIYMFGWWHDNSVLQSLGRDRYYRRANYIRNYPHVMEQGIQRNLSGGKVIWFVTHDNHVGIYEKALAWYDERGAFTYPGFQSVMKDREPDGDTFHLVQVVEEPTTVHTVSLPHTPVYLKDKDGSEITGCCTRPPVDSTAHLRTEDEYPEHLDAFALGFSAEITNARASLYEQLGDKLPDYHPELLLHQQGPNTPDPDRKEMLYPDERPSVRDHLHYGRLAAEVWIASKMGRSKPVRQLPLE